MAFNLSDLTDLSPFLYHVTYKKSLERIKRLQSLESAAKLMIAGGKTEWLRKRRDSLISFYIGSDRIILTDQKPINENNIEFQGGWCLPDLIEAINRRVFFWRGPESGLLYSNKGHFGKYQNEGHELVFIRASFVEVNELNAVNGPEVCKYNSGAARQNQGNRIPRGPDTFIKSEQSSFMRRDVQEVVFQDHVKLPEKTQICDGSWSGPWHALFKE